MGIIHYAQGYKSFCGVSRTHGSYENGYGRNWTTSHRTVNCLVCLEKLFQKKAKELNEIRETIAAMKPPQEQPDPNKVTPIFKCNGDRHYFGLNDDCCQCGMEYLKSKKL